MDGALAPILAIMVRNDEESNKMLDDSSKAQEELNVIKQKINELMHYNPEKTGETLIDYFSRLYEEPAKVVHEVLSDIKNPLKRMIRI